MGAVASSLATCLAALALPAGEAAAGDGPDGDAPIRTRQERAATVISAHVRRHMLLRDRMAGKALVGKLVRIAASAESAATVRRYIGCTGTVSFYDISTDCCHVDVGATTSESTLMDLEGRLAELAAMKETHDTASPEVQLRAQQLFGGPTVPMQLLDTAVIPRPNVVVIGVLSLATDGAADGASVALDPLMEREQLMLQEEITAALRSGRDFRLGGARDPDLGPPSGSGDSAPAGPPGDTSSAMDFGTTPPSESPPPSESSAASECLRSGGKRRLAGDNASARRPWGDLVRTDRAQAAAELAGIVSASTAGIGVAVSVNDPAMLQLFTEKTTATLDYAVDFKPRPALTSTAQRLDDNSRKWLCGGKVALAGVGGYASLRTRQLSPSGKWLTYPLDADAHTATVTKHFDRIVALLATCSDDELREFAFIDKKGHPCWTALCHFALELDSGRKEQAWAFNMLYAHDYTGAYDHNGSTPTVRASLQRFQASLMLEPRRGLAALRRRHDRWCAWPTDALRGGEGAC